MPAAVTRAGGAGAFFGQPIFDGRPTGHSVRRTFAERVRTWAKLANSLGNWRARPRFEPATPGLEGRSAEKTRNNTEQSGTESWFVCRDGSPATLCARPREGRERSWQAVDCPVAPRTEAQTTDSGADAGHRRHPWPYDRGVRGRGGGCRPRRRVRAPWAGGGPDGGRPETARASRDHRPLIAPAKSPLRALLEAVTRPPPAAVDRRPIRPWSSARTRSIRPDRSSDGCPSPPHIPLGPCRAHESECGPTVARPRPRRRRDLFHDPARVDVATVE